MTSVDEKTSRAHAETETSALPPIAIPSWKRFLDLMSILCTLPCWMTVMICVTLWIRVTSPGPAFFRQERVGLRGSRFMMLKFRSMKVSVETQSHETHFDGLVQSNARMTKLDAVGDSRLIPGGRFLRATGLDELPQLFNVIGGQMSLVGPRPCTVNELKNYASRQRERFDAAPGLTGYWQVNGKNSTTFRDMIELDIFYSRNKSLWLDLSIMMRTVPTLFGQFLESRALAQCKAEVASPIAAPSR